MLKMSFLQVTRSILGSFPTLSGPYLYCFFPTREGAIVKEYNLVNPHSFLKGMKKRGCEALCEVNSSINVELLSLLYVVCPIFSFATISVVYRGLRAYLTVSSD